jgi:acetyl esterase
MKSKITLLLLSLGLSFNALAQRGDPSVDPQIDPQIRVFLKGLNDAGRGKTPLYLLPGKGPGNALTGLQNQTQVDMSGVEITDKTITMDGLSVPVHIIRPDGKSGKLPVLLFIHGGVWIAGNWDNHKRLARDLAVGSGAIVVFPDYTLIREAKFPTQLNQCYATLKWIAAHGDEINADGSRIAIAGNSVGGNMTAATCLMDKDKNGPPIRFQLLLYPSVDANFQTGSYTQFANDRFLSRAFMQYGFSFYEPNLKARNNRYVAPLKATVAQLKGLPPTLIITSENDPLRDEGEAYGHKLREAGVDCTTVRYIGMIHDFQLLNAINKVPAVQASLRQAYLELRDHLQ